MYYFDNGNSGREHYAEMLKEGEQERFAAQVERHERKVRKQQNRQNRQPRFLAILGSLAR